MVCKNESLTNIDYSAYCAPNATFNVTYADVGPHVSLKTIHFTPDEKTRNPKVLFIAGWITHIQSWQAVLIEMTRTYEVIYLETREKISSSVRGKVPFTIEALGTDIINYVRGAFQPEEDYIIFASSLGATLALECAHLLNPKPKALILVAPNALFRVPWVMKLFVTLVHPDLYTMARPVIKQYLKHFRLNTDKDLVQYHKYCRALDNADPKKLKKAAKAFWNYSVWHRLPEMDVPTLVVGASKDKLHDPENLVQITQNLPNATYLDLGTNTKTHEADVVLAMHSYLNKL